MNLEIPIPESDSQLSPSRTPGRRISRVGSSKVLPAALTTVLILTASFQQAFGALFPVNLRCEYAINPLGVDVQSPRLSWTLESKQRAQRQSAYQILVASSEENLARGHGDLWDSGKVASDETAQIHYAGKDLKTAEQAFWKIRTWDARGEVSQWSHPGSWTMGILNDSDWRASWITAPDTNAATILLRREFTLKAALRRAVVNICGLGQYELTLNGRKAGDDFLSPGWTKYDKTCLYDTRDITALLRNGTNAIGIMLGNGMYNVPGAGRFTKFHGSFGPLKAIAQIRLEYADGSVEILGTGSSWRVASGPITFCTIYGGEDFDARLVQTGWDQPGFDDSKWRPVRVCDGPGGKLRGLSCAAPPIRFFEVHRPISTRTLTNGDVLFDLGQNASHVLRIRVTGPAGSSVRLTPAELINEDGTVNQGSMGAGRRGYVWCEFTKGTDHAEIWSPKFFYVGCRYVQVHLTSSSPGLTATLSPAQSGGKGRGEGALPSRQHDLPRIESLEGIVVHADCDPVGEFECSNPLFNRTRRLVRWAQLSNMMSVMTDCPHRERLGWLEQDHLNGPSLRYEFDMARLFTKTMNDIADSQLESGLVPTTAPEYTIFRDKTEGALPRNNFGDSPEWSSSFIIVPWQQYEFDGDLDLLRAYYENMKRYLAYLGSRATNHIVNYGLGDWYDLGPRAPGVSQLTPIALCATAFYFYDTRILAQAAALLGKTDDAKRFDAQAAQIRAAFNETFFNATNHDYATGSQTGNAIPLVMELCDPTNRAAVLDAIVRDVRSRGNALTSGDVGYQYLLRALADGGRSDVIFDMNDQTNHPGYGYQLAHGATSLTEAWNARPGASQNHFMLGQIEEWFYHDVAGIACDPTGPGFRKIIIKPQPVGDLTWARASYNSIRGRIVSDWKREENRFTLNVSIPANTSATVFVPAKSPEEVREGRKPAGDSEGVKFLREEDGRCVFSIESGEYHFEAVR